MEHVHKSFDYLFTSFLFPLKSSEETISFTSSFVSLSQLRNLWRVNVCLFVRVCACVCDTCLCTLSLNTGKLDIKVKLGNYVCHIENACSIIFCGSQMSSVIAWG